MKVQEESTLIVLSIENKRQSVVLACITVSLLGWILWQPYRSHAHRPSPDLVSPQTPQTTRVSHLEDTRPLCISPLTTAFSSVRPFKQSSPLLEHAASS